METTMRNLSAEEFVPTNHFNKAFKLHECFLKLVYLSKYSENKFRYYIKHIAGYHNHMFVSFMSFSINYPLEKHIKGPVLYLHINMHT